MSTRIVYHGGDVYIEASITADEELDAQTVSLSFDDGATYVAASWQGAAATTRTARTAATVDITTTFPTKGIYPCLAKVSSGVETEIIQCGAIDVR